MIKRNIKGKSSPKGRAPRTRKQRGTQILQVPGTAFYTDAERATLKFTDQIILVQGASAGALNQLNYKLNSLFQINATSSTGTAQGTAELAAKFKKYHVTRSRLTWRIRLLTPGAVFGNLGILGVAPTNSAGFCSTALPLQTGGATPATVTAMSVQKYASKRFDWPRVVGAVSTAELNPSTVWKGRLTMATAKLDADPDPKQPAYAAAFGTDPANLQYWVLAFQDVFVDLTCKGVWFCEVDILQEVYAFDRVVVSDALRLPVRPAIVTMGEERKEDLWQSPPPALSAPDGYVLVKRSPEASRSLK